MKLLFMFFSSLFSDVRMNDLRFVLCLLVKYSFANVSTVGLDSILVSRARTLENMELTNSGCQVTVCMSVCPLHVISQCEMSLSL